MFYSYDILNQKGKGQLAILWLLATEQYKKTGGFHRRLLSIKLADPW